MKIERVEFTLDLPDIRKQRIPIRDIRRILPPDESRFILHTDDDSTNDPYEITIHYQSDDIDHFHCLNKWFDAHSRDVLSGRRLALEVITPMKEYSLKII